MSEIELEILHNLKTIVVQGWIIVGLLVLCVIALWRKV